MRGRSFRGVARSGEIGQENRMETFLRSVETRAYRMAVMAGAGDDDALDLVQDAMMRFAAKYKDRERESWKPLFYAVLANRIRDYHRRRYLRRAWQVFLPGTAGAESDPVQQAPDTRGVTPELAAQAQDAFKAIEGAVQGLPHRQREAFLLRIWEEMSEAETARAMGCSKGSVKTHLSRALAALKQQLGEHWP